MIAHNSLTALLAAFALVGVAVAQDAQPHIDTISASSPGPGEPTDVKWTLDRDDLARLYPAVARAIAAPNFLIEVADDEQESTHAYFAEMARREANVIEVDGAVYTVGISIASGGMPPMPADEGAADDTRPPDATSHTDAPIEPARTGVLTGIAILAGLALLAGLAGLGTAALALRRK